MFGPAVLATVNVRRLHRRKVSTAQSVVLHEEIPHGDGRRRLVIVFQTCQFLIQLYFLKPFYFEEHYLLQPHLTPAFYPYTPQISIGVMQLALRLTTLWCFCKGTGGLLKTWLQNN